MVLQHHIVSSIRGECLTKNSVLATPSPSVEQPLLLKIFCQVVKEDISSKLYPREP